MTTTTTTKRGYYLRTNDQEHDIFLGGTKQAAAHRLNTRTPKEAQTSHYFQFCLGLDVHGYQAWAPFEADLTD